MTDVKLKALILIVLLVVPAATSVSYEDSGWAMILEERCEAGNITGLYVDRHLPSSEITLNGSEVERLECSRLEEYSYPERSVEPGLALDSGPSNTELAVIGSTPVAALYLVVVFICRKYGIARRKALKHSSLAVLSAVLGLIAAMVTSGFFNSDLTSLAFILVGILTPPAALLIKERNEISRKTAVKGFTALASSISALWLILVFLRSTI